MAPAFLSRVAPLVLLLASGVWAQFDMAECPTGFEFNKNSLGQDACLIGSMLDASCRDLVVYNYPPLNDSQYYLPPDATHSGDLTCDCNTVMYNLYMACASCQGGQVYPWIMWSANCASVYVGEYPTDIAQGTAVPHWAFFDITTLPDQTYNDTNAISIGRDPEEKPKAISTTRTSTNSPGKTSVKTNTRTSTNGPKSTNGSGSTGGGTSGRRKKSNTGAIVGGVLGTIIPLTALGIWAFFYKKRQQNAAEQQRVQNPEGLDPYQQVQAPVTPVSATPFNPFNPTDSPATANSFTQYNTGDPSVNGSQFTPYNPNDPPVTATQFAPYNPADPSTFPPQSPQTSVTYTTPTNNTSTRGNYTGIPEV